MVSEYTPLPIIETPAQMIEHLKKCEAEAVTRQTKEEFRQLRMWLEELEHYRNMKIA